MQRASTVHYAPVRDASLTDRLADRAPLAERRVTTIPGRGSGGKAIAPLSKAQPPDRSLPSCSLKARLAMLRFLPLSFIAVCGFASFGRPAIAEDFTVISNRT